MKKFLVSALSAGVLAAFASSAAQADTLVASFRGADFDQFVGSTFKVGDHISGYVQFDSSLLSASGDGLVQTYAGAINPDILWQFQDGHNVFNQTNDTSTFGIYVQFANFLPVGWEIDPTWGVTPAADIWTNRSANSNISYYKGDSAWASVGTSPADWTVTRVPEPGSLALLGLGLGVAALARRRQNAR